MTDEPGSTLDAAAEAQLGTEEVGQGSQAGPRCPWCSAPLASAVDATCGACGATLVGPAGQEPSDDVPGVTAVSPELLARQRRFEQPRLRGLRGLFGSDETSAPIEPPSQAELEAIAPPDVAVRCEMLRLELEAAVAEAKGEVAAAEAEAAVGGPAVVEAPGPAETGVPGETAAPADLAASSDTPAASDTAASGDTPASPGPATPSEEGAERS